MGHYSKQKHQYSDHQKHHNTTTEKRRAWTNHRGSCCVMWPSRRLSPWAPSVCSGLLGRRGWPSWTNWLILTCILIFWVMRNSAFKRPFPIDCGFGVSACCVCVCVYYSKNRVAQSLQFLLCTQKKKRSLRRMAGGVKCLFLCWVCEVAFASNLCGAVRLGWKGGSRNWTLVWFACGVKAKQTNQKILWQQMCVSISWTTNKAICWSSTVMAAVFNSYWSEFFFPGNYVWKSRDCVIFED